MRIRGSRVKVVGMGVMLSLVLACSGGEAPQESEPSLETYEHGMVVSVHELASEVGVEILRQGGNAVDAAVATSYALEKFGTMSRQEVLAPAIKLAREGWVLDRPMGGEDFRGFPSTNAVFNRADGSRYEAGEVWAQPHLARTLEAIAERGRDGFYRGETADLIVATMETHGGLISLDDLRNYQVKERTPLQGSYRGHGVVSMPPVSSGGTTLLELLNILERYDLGSMAPDGPEKPHLLAEAMRRGFADRNWYIADPDFVEVPTDLLITKAFADLRAADIVPDRATKSTDVVHGDVTQVGPESDETTHFSLADGRGMAVAVTTTINAAYGNRLVVEGAGFLLNNQMGDFSARAGVANHSGHVYGEANGIEPHKRMISSQTPTIVTKDGENFLVLGAAGSGKIITGVLQAIVNVVDHGMSIGEAVLAPRIHHQWLPDQIEYDDEFGGGFPPATLEGLQALGHTLIPRKHGYLHALMIDPGTGQITGVADPRRIPSGRAVGY